MTQKLLTGTEEDAFNNLVNDYLKTGWKVVPNTLQASVSSTTADQGFGDRVYVNRSYAVVVEKE